MGTIRLGMPREAISMEVVCPARLTRKSDSFIHSMISPRKRLHIIPGDDARSSFTWGPVTSINWSQSRSGAAWCRRLRSLLPNWDPPTVAITIFSDDPNPKRFRRSFLLSIDWGSIFRMGPVKFTLFLMADGTS